MSFAWCGGMAEWFKAAVLKTVECNAPWVRILLPPPQLFSFQWNVGRVEWVVNNGFSKDCVLYVDYLTG